MKCPAVILDTNVFVAAGFKQRSISAAIVELVRAGRLRMVWNQATRRETEYILNKIPRLSWRQVADLFREADEHAGPVPAEEFAVIPDPDDRKYAALAAASGAVLLTNDDHLLSSGLDQRLEIQTPRQFWQQYLSADEDSGTDP